METTIRILPLYQAEAEAALAKLSKRAGRYGQALTWTHEAVQTKEMVRRWDGEYRERNVTRLVYTIQGAAPRVGDYRLVAQLESFPTGIIITGEETGELGRGWRGQCDHCGANRQRRLAYVVEDKDGGRLVVGKSCLRDHLGTDTPAHVLSAFTYLAQAGELGDEEGGWGGGSGWWCAMTLDVLATARAAIALYGWSSASGNRDSSTLARVRAATSPLEPRDRERLRWRKEIRAELEARGDHYETAAQDVLDWARDLVPDNDYQNNLKVVLAMDTVEPKHTGLIVSAAAAYGWKLAAEARAQELAQRRREEAEAKAAKGEPHEPTSAWLGAVGQRLTATVILERVVDLGMGEFGPRLLYGFRTTDGSKLSWFTGTGLYRAGKRVEAGDKLAVKFTVKAHKEFRGEKDTQVNRVAVVEEKAK